MIDRKKPLKTRKERAVRRCPFVASAEVTDANSDTRLSARISELGVGGCYVDAMNPFPEGTAVTVRILRDQGAFETKGKVVYCHPACGMGLSFTETEPSQRSVLEEWLAEAVRELRPVS
ncbi:MAG TPA: PilZ domain-containing protein [Candidatus Acidoferrales bacterium]|nr:PilZ domain-containing protein [Candidatus Acidoferrales bacterium]